MGLGRGRQRFEVVQGDGGAAGLGEVVFCIFFVVIHPLTKEK